MIGPEEVIRLKNWKHVPSRAGKTAQHTANKQISEAHDVGNWSHGPVRVVVAKHNWFDSFQTSEGPLFELDQLGTVGCATLGEDMQNWSFALFVDFLTLLNLLKDFSALFFGVTTFQVETFDHLRAGSDRGPIQGFHFRQEAWEV